MNVHRRQSNQLASWIIILELAALASASCQTDASTFGENRWSSLGGLPGVAGSVYSMTTDERGNLFVTGDFNVIGDQITSMAEWDGTNWTALGSGADGGIFALAASGNNLYVGGAFTSVSGVTASNVARWDGSEWAAMGSGVNGQVSSLLVSNNGVFASGSLTASDGTFTPIMMWDGTHWMNIGRGLNNQGASMALLNGALYAAGYFSFAGTNVVDYIAKWDGTNWTSAGTNATYGAHALAVFRNALYASGLFMAGTNEIPAFAKLEGNEWTPVGPTVASIPGVGVSGDTLYLTGSATNGKNFLDSWDGNTWTTLDTNINGAYEMTTYGSNVYIGGSDLTEIEGVGVMGLAHWDGARWQAMGTGLSGPVNALAPFGTNIFAGGDFLGAGGQAAHYVAQWGGRHWHPAGAGFSGPVSALAVWSSNLFAGGSFTNTAALSANYVSRWNGSIWVAVGAGPPGPVLAFATSSNLYAGGAYGVTAWDGSQWTSLGTGLFNVDALLAVSNTVYAAQGPYVGQEGEIYRWQGGEWVAIGPPINFALIRALALWRGNLYASVYVPNPPRGPSYAYLGEWDGSQWTLLPSPSGVPASSLLAWGGHLFFGSAGVQVWDGAQWSGIGSGIQAQPGSVGAMTVVNGRLYLGGNFDIAGDKVSSFAAMADIRPTLTIAPNGSNLALIWDDSSFVLQSATNVAGPFADELEAASPYTNDSSAGQKFFRLRQP